MKERGRKKEKRRGEEKEKRKEKKEKRKKKKEKKEKKYIWLGTPALGGVGHSGKNNHFLIRIFQKIPN